LTRLAVRLEQQALGGAGRLRSRAPIATNSQRMP
jgi:hypothetical protein